MNNYKIREALLNASGVSIDILLKYKWEIQYFVSFGALIYLTAILSTFTMSYFIASICDNPAVIILLSLVWGAIIFHLNRLIILAPTDENVWAKLAKFCVRFFISIIIGLLIAIPCELLFFQKSISIQLNSHAQKVYELNRDSLSNNVKALKGKRDSILNAKSKQYNADKDFKKTFALQKNNQKNSAPKFEPDTSSNLQLSFISSQINELNEIMAEPFIPKPIETFDIGDRYEAFTKLSEGLSSKKFISLLLMIAFILVDSIPVIAKLMVTMNSYDHNIDIKHEKSFYKKKRKKEKYANKKVAIDISPDAFTFSQNGNGLYHSVK